MSGDAALTIFDVHEDFVTKRAASPSTETCHPFLVATGIPTLGLFYDFTGDDADSLASEWKTCPHCGAELSSLPGIARIEVLIKEGRKLSLLSTRKHDARKYRRACKRRLLWNGDSASIWLL